jgi:hypothetical protein
MENFQFFYVLSQLKQIPENLSIHIKKTKPSFRSASQFFPSSLFLPPSSEISKPRGKKREKGERGEGKLNFEELGVFFPFFY